MQIDQIRLADVVKQEASKGAGVLSGVEEKKETEALRTIQMDAPFYNKNSVKENSIADKIEKDMNRGEDGTQLLNQVAVYANTTSPEDLKKMQEEGFNPNHTEAKTIVTVVDRIKLALAKGGADISSMGGLDASKIEAMTGSTLAANAVEQQMKEADLPLDENVMEDVKVACNKMEELSGQVTGETVKYLLRQDMAPTIDNLYQASFGGGSVEYTDMSQRAYKAVEDVTYEMEEAFTGILQEAGISVNPDTLKECQWMVEQKIPVTEESVSYFNDLKELQLDLSPEELAQTIVDALREGKTAGEAVLLPQYSTMAQARDAYEVQQSQLSNITSERVREEARMLMSVEANYALLKRGVAIDTLSIQETVDALKDLERSYLKEVFGGQTEEASLANVDTFQTFTQQLQDLKGAPAAVLGAVEEVSKYTVTDLLTRARSLWSDEKKVSLQSGTASFAQATERYESLWTWPRKDLGDSIQKAFANVDDILEDLGLDTSDANQRAIRILSYNEKALTEENIAQVKAADAQVQRVFTAMKPATVIDMIRQGVNPLDKSMEELADVAQSMEQDGEGKQEESFSKFLWKMEQVGDISPEERESYIGIYRLIHQVEASDGAVIGALLAQGSDVTLRNMMTAVRSGKHTGREYAIDDDFGGLEGFDKTTLSITDQIETAYQTNCLIEAGQLLTPVKMKEFPDENSYMELSPERFKDALWEMEKQVEVTSAEAEQEKTYAAMMQREVTEALKSESQIYEILERNDIPNTPAYLAGVTQLMQQRNEMYRKLLHYGQETADHEMTIRDLMESLIEDYGEAVKTPEEMAEAERKLEETAENVMKKMLVESDVKAIDVRGMKLVMTQIHALGKIAENSETYHLPIMVEDEVGNLTLKIVRGEESKGLVDVALSMDETGTVYGSFRYEAGEINGNVTFERRDMQQAFAEHMPLIAEDMREATGLPVSFTFPWDKQVDVNQIYEEREVGFTKTKEQDEVSTKILYGVARSFINNMKEIISGDTNFF